MHAVLGGHGGHHEYEENPLTLPVTTTLSILAVLVALVVGTGICERIWSAERRPVLARGHVHSLTRTGLDGRPVPVEQDGSARPVLLLMAEQLAEPFQAQG